MRPQPATFRWFAAHDLKLARRRVRAFFGKSGPIKITLILGAALVFFHALALFALDTALEDFEDGRRALYPFVGSAALFILPWIVSQALTNATRALYTRGDLDIVLSSPMPARPVFAARSLAIALESIFSVAIFVLPIANALALLADGRWLAIYPTLAAAGLFGTGLGLVLMLGLFRFVGPRRTRVVANVLATLIGASFAIGLQAYNIAPAAYRMAISEWLSGARAGGLLDRDSLIWIPIRAAGGEPWPLLLWCGVSLALFLAAVLTLGDFFMRGAGAAIGSERREAPQVKRATRFRAGVGAALRHKEWRLISRDPGLASQILLQIIYTMPISVVLWRAMGPNGSLALATAPALVAVASNVSASLAWLAISSEDAPEFLATAPVTRREIERRKLEAIALPLIVIVALPLAFVWSAGFKAGAVTTVYVLAAALAAALLNLWHPVPGRRGDILRRHSQSKLVAMMEHMLSLLWAVALALTAFGSWAAMVPIVCALFLLWTQRPKAVLATA
ncbi:MAG: hypothetical protein H6872_02650 [Methylobacteriaceae bacterium]|nr:hypothetical protein [Rhodoblastus sp.]MCC0004089.1 hypothetical protein [Methylobacteriaceae bacterium]